MQKHSKIGNVTFPRSRGAAGNDAKSFMHRQLHIFAVQCPCMKLYDAYVELLIEYPVAPRAESAVGLLLIEGYLEVDVFARAVDCERGGLA